ncbi:unnamed protein product [Spirodela intermedia]|uniref:Histidine kinase/HSP90-like ATPase domain-containing protein n=1 Tax=Spirodela intermedia TaxID=51605 RepID=A0A7I8INS5_SPIIN|nr:unnamed protein product [Spirodela intermedia]CAA6659556.1 unnamed protein product [Spirodela intermedia]
MLLLPAPAKLRLYRPLIFCRCNDWSPLQLSQGGHRSMAVRCSPPRLETLAFDGDELSARGRAARPVSSTVDAAPGGDESGDFLITSARAVAAAIRRASAASPVEFVLRMEKDVRGGSAGPSPDFLRLCVEQMDLFRMVVDREAVLSVYVRPAGSYVMDQLELHRVNSYSQVDSAEIADCVVLIGNFVVPAGLRAAEAHLSDQQVAFIPECGAIVLPMVKHPFVVGFIVAELPFLERKTFQGTEDNEQHSSFGSSSHDAYELRQSDKRIWEIQSVEKNIAKYYHQFTAEHSARAITISRSLAMAYVMDQKAMLLQQSSWQNNIRGPLSNMRTLTKMLSVQLKRSEVSLDIIEGILVQGDHMKDTLQQLQDAVYLTKANIVRYNEETLKKVHDSAYEHPELAGSLLPDYSLREMKEITQKMDSKLALSYGAKDVEVPMPPLALAPEQENIRPCNVSDVLADLVSAAAPLAHKQERLLKLAENSQSLEVAVEESALRQALSNLIEGALLRTNIGGGVEIIATGAPAGGVLIVIDDDGPDMHYMTQMHSLTPFGADLFQDDMVEDNMTWNFVAGLTISREILESYGCVVRVISPRSPNAALGTGGTRIELWLPTLTSDLIDSSQGSFRYDYFFQCP